MLYIFECSLNPKKAGKRSSPQHRLTHILLKFEQLIDYGIKECKDSFKHENLGERIGI